MLFKGTLMGTTLCGMLTIYERVILFTILIGMSKGYFYIVALKMYYRIKSIASHTILQQILQTMTRQNATTIIHNGESDIQVSIVAQHILHDFIVKLIVNEL